MWQYNYTQYSDELYHYGVLGMKWGKRKSTYSDKEISDYRKKRIAEAPTKAESPIGSNKGWYKNAPKSTLRREMQREAKEEYKNSAEGRAAAAKRAKALKVGAAVAGTALATYGSYKVSQLSKKPKPKPFTTEQLRSMGIATFEPERIRIATFEPERIRI